MRSGNVDDSAGKAVSVARIMTGDPATWLICSANGRRHHRMAAALAAAPFNGDHMAALSEYSALLVPVGPIAAGLVLPRYVGAALGHVR